MTPDQPAASAAPLILCLPSSNRATAERLALAAGGSVLPVGSVAEIAALWPRQQPLIGVMASGILIRALAPLLGDKQAGPPVLAASQDGATIVPLLGGHRGANRLARRLAAQLGAQAAITTASDSRGGPAFDAPPPGWHLTNPADHKDFAAAYLAADPTDQARLAAALGRDRTLTLGSRELRYQPRDLAVGIGCARNVALEELEELVIQHVAEPARIAGFYSVTVKQDEVALLALAEKWQRPIRFFAPETLAAQPVPNPSDVVRAEVGTPSVAEAAALCALGSPSGGPSAGRLILPKQKSANATLAIAAADAPFDGTLGRNQHGRLTVLGTGPGDLAHLSPAALAAVARASDLVGFGLYLDLLGDYAAGKTCHARALGEEEQRCRLALDLALEGREVALVCSGDPAIYAMAALVYEVLAADPQRYASVELLVEPGISAFQLCAARSGALIGHDFCCISLSNLLTPWEQIERRIRAAAEGDFVVAFYNPVSQRRDWQLAAARDILLGQRPADTPVVIGRNLARPGEQVRQVTLATLDPASVDMLSLVLVGSSQSRRLHHQGQPRAFTPRGYAAKEGSRL